MPYNNVNAAAVRILSPKKISAVYVLIVIGIGFCIWIPDTFPTTDTARQVLNSSAITGVAATGLVLPLAAGVFDTSVSYTMTLTGVLSTYLVSSKGLGVFPAVVIALLAGLAVGVVNAVVVVGFRINSFIGTLAMGLVIQALVTFISGGNTITGIRLNGSFSRMSQASIDNVTVPVFVWVILAAMVFFFLDFTVFGRRLYATGFNLEAARLAAVRVKHYQVGSLLLSSLIAGVAGILLASSIESGDPSSGNPYLLPCYAAVFLGATQFREGRFNPWGTALATLLVGTGTVGLGLAAAPQWAGSLFSGVVLLGSLALFERRKVSSSGGAQRSARRSAEPGAGNAAGDTPIDIAQTAAVADVHPAHSSAK